MKGLFDGHGFLHRHDPCLVVGKDGSPPAPELLLGLFALAFAGSLAIAAVATPIVFSLAAKVQSTTGAPIARAVLDSNVPKIFTGIRWICVLVVVPIALRAMSVRSVHDLGLSLDRRSAAGALPWLFAGFATAGAAVALQLAFSPGTIRTRPGSIAVDVVSSFGIGFGAGVVELLVFCGLVLRMFYGGLKAPWLAMLATAAFYAFAHIKAPAQLAESIAHAHTLHASTALAVGTLFGSVSGVDLARFTGLIAIGLACAALTLRFASLWPGIWLYTGLISVKQLAMKWWRVDTDVPHRMFGTEQLLDGFAPALILLALAVTIIVWPRAGDVGAEVDPNGSVRR